MISLEKSGTRILFSVVFFISVPCAVLTQEKTPTVVTMIAFNDQKEKTEHVINAVQSQLSDLKIDFNILWEDEYSPRPSFFLKSLEKPSAGQMIFWCDIQEDDLFLFISAPESVSGDVSGRLIEGSSIGGKAETTAIIIRSAVVSCLNGHSERGTAQTMKQAEDSEAAQIMLDSRIPADSSQDNHSLFFRSGYTLGVLSDSLPLLHGLGLVISYRFHPDWHLFAGFIYFPAVSTSDEEVELSVYNYPAMAGARYSYAFGIVRIGPALSLHVNTMKEEVKVLQEGLAPAESSHEIEVSIIPQFFLAVTIVEDLDFYITAGAEVLINRIVYRQEISGENVRVWNPWPVQPYVQSGLSIKFL